MKIRAARTVRAALLAYLLRTHPMDATLDLFRNERNIVARRPKTAQVAVKRAWHEAEHANVHQRDDPTWISSFPRVAKLIPES